MQFVLNNLALMILQRGDTLGLQCRMAVPSLPVFKRCAANYLSRNQMNCIANFELTSRNQVNC